MYSDMSMRTIASSSPKRNSASVRASSVLPTPDGPRKTNEPVGRLGSLRAAGARLGLPAAGGAEEEKGAGRALGVLEARARAPDRLRDDLDRRVLADDALV